MLSYTVVLGPTVNYQLLAFIQPHRYAKNKVQLMFCGLGACVYVCCSHSSAVLKCLNRSKSHLGEDTLAQGTMFLLGLRSPRLRDTFRDYIV